MDFYKKITEEDVYQYIQKTFDVELPETLFSPAIREEDESFYIINQTLKNFSGHWINKSGILVGEHPKEPIHRWYFSNYIDFKHMESVEDLFLDIQEGRKRAEQNLKNFYKMMDKDVEKQRDEPPSQDRER